DEAERGVGAHERNRRACDRQPEWRNQRSLQEIAVVHEQPQRDHRLGHPPRQSLRVLLLWRGGMDIHSAIHAERAQEARGVVRHVYEHSVFTMIPVLWKTWQRGGRCAMTSG